MVKSIETRRPYLLEHLSPTVMMLACRDVKIAGFLGRVLINRSRATRGLMSA
jgi:hypothetical protein